MPVRIRRFLTLASYEYYPTEKLLVILLSNTLIRYVIDAEISPDGLVRAQNAGIPTRYHNLLDYKKCYPDNTSQARAEFDKDLAKYLLADCPDLVVCAGWYVPNYLWP